MAEIKILCAEDNPLVVDMIKSVLEKEFGVVIASNGVEAIEKIYHEAPDLILLDVMMPKMGGHEVCRVIKEMNETKGLPVIMVTTKDHKMDRLWGKTTGADEYITKPFEPPELLGKVRALLSARAGQIEESKRLLASTDVFRQKQSLTAEDILSKVNEMLDKKLFESMLMAEISQIGHFKYGYEEVMLSILDIFYKAIDYEAAVAVFPMKQRNPFMIYSRKTLSRDFTEQLRKKSMGLLPPDLMKSFSFNEDKVDCRSRENAIEESNNERTSSCHVSPMEAGGKTLGAFIFYSHIQDAYDEYQRNIINTLTAHALPVIENSLWLDVQRQIQEDRIKSERLEELVELRTAELNESEEKYHGLYDSLQDGIVMASMDGAIVQCNQAFLEMTGYQEEEIKKLAYGQLTPEKWHDIESTIIREQVVKRGYSEDYEKEYIRKDGAAFPVKLKRYLVRDKEGNPSGMWAIVRDITERNNMQERILTSERLATIGQFSGSVAHELRNPLATIDSSIYYLRETLPDADDKVKQHMTRIKTSTDDASSIIQSILNLTRMKDPVLKILKLKPVIEESIAISGVPDTVEIARDYRDEQATALIDNNQLQIAFKNIIRNAVEAMDKRGKLGISVRPEKDRIEIRFTDSGPGVAPENLNRIFQPLFTTKTKGIGFGLSITNMVVEKHGGTIKAESMPGNGTSIIIDIPAAG